jgi:hypothetical protein
MDSNLIARLDAFADDYQTPYGAWTGEARALLREAAAALRGAEDAEELLQRSCEQRAALRDELIEAEEALKAERAAREQLQKRIDMSHQTCDCGLTWLDDGLNPLWCPYCALSAERAAREQERNEHLRHSGQCAECGTWTCGYCGVSAEDGRWHCEKCWGVGPLADAVASVEAAEEALKVERAAREYAEELLQRSCEQRGRATLAPPAANTDRLQDEIRALRQSAIDGVKAERAACAAIAREEGARMGGPANGPMARMAERIAEAISAQVGPGKR